MFALLPLRYVTIQVDASWRQDVAAVFASDFSSAWPRSVVELIRRLAPGFLGWELDFFAIQMSVSGCWTFTLTDGWSR